MPVPPFVLSLREKVGHDLLWLSGVSGIIFDDSERVLLTQRRDNSWWSVVSGILEPGEQPAVALKREVLEETGVVASVGRLVSVLADIEPTTLGNADRCQYLDLAFRCRYVSGTATVADDENLAVAWFDLDRLPALRAKDLDRISWAREPEGEPVLVR